MILFCPDSASPNQTSRDSIWQQVEPITERKEGKLYFKQQLDRKRKHTIQQSSWQGTPRRSPKNLVTKAQIWYKSGQKKGTNFGHLAVPINISFKYHFLQLLKVIWLVLKKNAVSPTCKNHDSQKIILTKLLSPGL